MSPFRLLITIVLAVVVTVLVYTFIQVAFSIVNATWNTLYGRNFTWSDLPQPLGPVMRDLWNVVAPNFFLICFVLALIVEFIVMYSYTQEGYQYPVYG
jgi:hypothetical protein